MDKITDEIYPRPPKTSKRSGAKYVLEFYQSHNRDWRWRYLYVRGEMRRILSQSSEGYKRRVNAIKCWQSTREREFSSVVIPLPQSPPSRARKPAAGQ